MKRRIIIKTNSKIIIHQTEFSMNLAFYFYMFLFWQVWSADWISASNDQMIKGGRHVTEAIHVTISRDKYRSWGKFEPRSGNALADYFISALWMRKPLLISSRFYITHSQHLTIVPLSIYTSKSWNKSLALIK